MLSIQPKDYWTMAAKAVKAYANKKFAGFFQEADVEDIVAEVVTKMWRARGRFDPDRGSEFGWVWTIAKNAVRDAAIAKRNRKDIGGGWNDSVDEKADGMEAEDLADRQLYEEIAEQEGLTMRATYMAVFHMRRRLNNDAA